MIRPKVEPEELSDFELAVFIGHITKELAEMAKERGFHTLIPSLRSSKIASDNVLKKMRPH